MYIVWLSAICLATAVKGQNFDQRTRCWSSGNGESARWWDEGQRIDRGRYWYICTDGELKPQGCFTPSDERLSIHGTFIQNAYEMECVLNPSGYLEFAFSACIGDDGKKYKVGETWEDPKHMYWFVCNQDGPYLKADVGGCVTHDKSKRISLDESYDFGEYIYKCMRKYNGTIQMCSVGCVHNGVHYKIGEQWPDGDYVYYCKLNGGRCQKACVGCQFLNKRLYDGDRYQKGDTVFQCEVRPDRYGHKPVACVVHDENNDIVERIVGCRWYQTLRTGKVEQTCVLENNRTLVKTVGCVYVYKGFDTLFLYPNTYTIWSQQMDGKTIGVACREGINGGGPTVDTFDMTEIAFKTIGLKYEQPRGK